ncbi:hypothetical protein SADUNF_Sadunf01G0147600 [Salix dunnii]|uniref:Uncharacterized protein n=1 Tax=Salix dunnii TaxID=1413687 RepID=A0A835TMW1_9ROSI|nr:hypothetical protein SADUNF_Sadunf01G0147600 [Salix dunnii]
MERIANCTSTVRDTALIYMSPQCGDRKTKGAYKVNPKAQYLIYFVCTYADGFMQRCQRQEQQWQKQKHQRCSIIRLDSRSTSGREEVAAVLCITAISFSVHSQKKILQAIESEKIPFKTISPTRGGESFSL